MPDQNQRHTTAQGGHEGAAGYWYSLTEDPALPPQIFTHEQIEALVLRLREVQAITDPSLARAAEHALAKLHGTLPAQIKNHLKHSVLHEKRFHKTPALTINPALIRQAALHELVIAIDYCDANGATSSRRIYPLSIVYLDATLVLLSYCCPRKTTRVTRFDRIDSISITQECFHPKRVKTLRTAVAEAQGKK